MLPISLLRVHASKGRIHPVYAEVNERNLNLAAKLLHCFQKHHGKQKGRLLKNLSSYETAVFDYKFVRGLSLILQRLCTFQVDSPVDPRQVRRLAFEEAGREGVVATNESRRQVLRRVAKQLNVTPKKLERSLYADLEEELILTGFSPIGAAELLTRYNLSLTQTLLFRSTLMQVTVSDHWKDILRDIKFRGLMYSAETVNGALEITVDGPLSLFKLTHRYGTSMAKVLPRIVQARQWQINADVVRNTQRGKRILRLTLRSDEVGSKIRPSSLERSSSEPAFDSKVEETFFRDFQSLRSGWKIVREPSPLIAGKHVMIPDFRLEKNEVMVYLEIAGFWTQKYLENKIKKLQQLHGVDILVAANQQLACSRLKGVGGNVIFYKNKVPLRPIFKFLKNREEKLLRQEIEKLNLASLRLKGDVVMVHDLAKKHGVSDQALRRKLTVLKIPGYTLIGETLINAKKIRELDLKISAMSKSPLSRVLHLIESEGVKHPLDLLSKLNYSIRWNGLDVNKSSIIKKRN